ncbi:IPT/TIG domain-containing protein [Actinoplanes sp. DH11]|uniref:IPT/TIG domain-containing protein n=1 Tax=Actinoplanes sp. DH11 TaxID=2857011 RepID=UPI001E3EF103|nr:IPT/TIG domain-containing protein [Actinoplanes sp. DH11]
MKRTIRRSALASAAAVLLVLAGLSAPASAAAVSLTLSKTYGPSGGGGTLLASVSTGTLPAPFPAGTTPVVQFQYVGTGSTGCNTTARPETAIAATGTTATAGVLTVDSGKVKRITAWKIVFQVPTGPSTRDPAVNTTGLVLAGSQVQAKWSVCVYDTLNPTTGSLLGTAAYTIALRPTITSILPASSAAGGGQTITVNGTGFTANPVALTGSIGGAPLTSIRVSGNGNSFTATTGPRAPAAGLDVTVVTPGGTVSSLDPDNDPNTADTPIPFAYTNAISVSPNTATAGETVTLDVTGAGFSQLNVDTSGVPNPTSSQAHVFLVAGAYDSNSNRGVAECLVAVVVSDNELVCDVNLTGVPDGAYILTLVADGAPGAASPNPSIISSGAVFVVGPY